ncbi:hypothetical protein PR001_g14078 [Phytophthora rubi]|uniref:Peptidase C1A papain C-terminal domain-containing protein n=2 Tax=Phytophthora rubi TaxID=129364 RepID=A0A6A3LQZ5_9STRA|nr:hypothetical protein PR001_g14078 [Phytophthora rubi]
MRQSATSCSALRCIGVAVIAAAAVSGVSGRQMHVGIDYHRYLAERDVTRQELADWKSSFGDMAKKNGWMPPSSSNSEERSADDEDEDHLQRFFMTKQNISVIQALNLNANFSTNTPFTLLTNDEFAAYVGKAYRAYNASSVSWHRSSSTKTTYSSSSTPSSGTTSKTVTTSASSGTPTVLQGTVNGDTSYTTTSVKSVTTTGADGKSTTTTSTTTSSGPGTESTTVTTSSGSATNAATNFGFGSGFSSLWQQWGNGFNFGGMGRNDFHPETVKPAGSDSSSTPTTTTPTPTTPAPTTPITAAPATAAPTTTPTPTTAAPSVTQSTSTTTVKATDTSTTSSSNEVDWTSSSCMSPIQSQGSCGDCWAFSTAAAIESGQCIHGGQKSLNKYSEQQLTSCDTQNYGCNGGAPIYAMEYVQQNGLCTEDDYPYTSSDGTAASCSTGCSAVDPGLTGYQTVDDASGLATAVAQQPVIVAVASGNNAWKQYTGGVISSCDTSELDHAVVVVGYTDSEWKIRNSWGESWGEEGYIRLERTSDSTGTCGMYGDMSYPTF